MTVRDLIIALLEHDLDVPVRFTDDIGSHYADLEAIQPMTEWNWSRDAQSAPSSLALWLERGQAAPDGYQKGQPFVFLTGG